jgi:neutral ceramidase
MIYIRRFICLSFLFIVGVALSVEGAELGKLRVGAARLDITPSEDALPPPYTTIHDHIYVRAIVVDNGDKRIAIVSKDGSGIDSDSWTNVSQRIARDEHIPSDNLLVAGTHSHSAPGGGPGGGAGSDPNALAFAKMIENAVLTAVHQAAANLRLARVKFGTGQSFLNVSSNEWLPLQNRYIIASDPTRTLPSDHRVPVVEFEDLNGGPIAIFINFAAHATVFNAGGGTQVSADFPGFTSRYIEQIFNDKVVAVWTSGAAGDQHIVNWYRAYEKLDASGKPVLVRSETHPDINQRILSLFSEADHERSSF